MAIYSFKTDEDIDTQSRTIIKEEIVPAVPETTKETEFTLENKEKQLQSLKEQKISISEQIVELETEIAEIKTALKIT